MTIKLLVIGKTQSLWLSQGIEDYINRLNHYLNFEIIELNSSKKLSTKPVQKQKKKEGELFLNEAGNGGTLYLLDEQGSNYSSKEFADFLQKSLNSGVKTIFFAIGGPYGFSPEVKARAHKSISLSKMTFTHDMARLIFVEQLYRGCTILKGEKYHHD